MSLCRACLSEDTLMNNLFDEFDQGFTLADILQINTPFEVSPDDNLSEFLCQSCTNILVDFHNFKTVYENNLQVLQDQLEEQNNIEQKQKLEELRLTQLTNLKEEVVKNTDTNGTVLPHTEDTECTEDERIRIHVSTSDAENITDQSQIDGSSVKNELIKLETFECEKCSENFVDSTVLEKHMEETHNMQYVDLEDYRKHLFINICPEEAEIPTMFNCTQCETSFQNENSLKSHENEHKPHICDRCGRRFAKKYYLTDHQEIHTNEYKYKCEYCSKLFRRRAVFSKHRRIHTNPREFVCDLCGKQFNDLGTLKTHVNLVHRKERNFKCPLCMLSFPMKQTLEKHIKRHNKQRKKEFVCSECMTEYSDKSSLKRHYNIKHNKQHKRMACEYCTRTFTTKTNLFKHIRKFHTDDKEERPH